MKIKKDGTLKVNDNFKDEEEHKYLAEGNFKGKRLLK